TAISVPRGAFAFRRRGVSATLWRESVRFAGTGDPLMRRLLSSVVLVLLAGFLWQKPSPLNPDPDAPRPIEGVDTIFIEEMTWMEVRDALKSGKDTVLIPTGGVEQNGPYLATGKHDVVLRATSEAIARKLGNTLVAPIVPFVPEGDIEPPTSHMKYPGT